MQPVRMRTSLGFTDEMKQPQIHSLKQKLLRDRARTPRPAGQNGALDRLSGCDLASQAWPFPMDGGPACCHHEPPCRAHPIHTTTTDLEIIYKPELHRNRCLSLLWQQGCGTSTGLEGTTEASEGGRFPAGSPQLPHAIGGHRELKEAFNCASSEGWHVSRKAAPPGCLAAGSWLGFSQSS